MVEPKVGMEFVRDSWEAPGHISAYIDADGKVGLWDSEHLLVSKYCSKADGMLDIGCGAGRTMVAHYRLGYSRVQGMDLSDSMPLLAVLLTKTGQARRKVLLWVSAVLLLGFCALESFSIGLFYLPAALALVFSAILGSRRAIVREG